ncbi:uncharacterized protein LOC111313699 isoform X1 [Durio zibethinus]|uniref:Uncharacterized protein LOC111313699 isoform X1 n=1 Tax=Durio zibethinus TaxID=66656 RepID=A0A6P6AYZ8_DURZI|nr:uncharacterized protein LOC111313699 isoform X1 [Durio zibethinus]
MTQKGNLFKGHKKQKTIPPNRHGKLPHIRKGKRVVKPSKLTKEMDADRFKTMKYLVFLGKSLIQWHSETIREAVLKDFPDCCIIMHWVKMEWKISIFNMGICMITIAPRNYKRKYGADQVHKPLQCDKSSHCC